MYHLENSSRSHRHHHYSRLIVTNTTVSNAKKHIKNSKYINKHHRRLNNTSTKYDQKTPIIGHLSLHRQTVQVQQFTNFSTLKPRHEPQWPYRCPAPLSYTFVNIRTVQNIRAPDNIITTAKHPHKLYGGGSQNNTIINIESSHDPARNTSPGWSNIQGSTIL